MIEVALPAVATLSTVITPTSSLQFANTLPASLTGSPQVPATLTLTMRTISSGASEPDGIVRALTAGQTLSGHRAVYVASGNAMYADAANLSQAQACAGITLGAANAGETVSVQTDGPVTEPSWTWTPGPVYLGAAGALTQTIPTTGALVEVGIASSPTELDVRVRSPIYLN